MLESDAVDILFALGELLLGPEPDLQFVHPRICVVGARDACATTIIRGCAGRGCP